MLRLRFALYLLIVTYRLQTELGLRSPVAR